MTYARFEDLPVWGRAIDLAVRVDGMIRRDDFPGTYSVKDQLGRAVLSISNNIAEGFERGFFN